MRSLERRSFITKSSEMTSEERQLKASLEQEIVELQASLDERLPRKARNRISRKLRLTQARLNRLEQGDYGRRIPEAISEFIITRDKDRDFGRPHHTCQGIKPPHHIRHFETFKGNHTRENPHTADNLEAPCRNCHDLAHALNVPSGTSIEDFFKSFTQNQWLIIERLWFQKKISQLNEIVNSI